MVQMKYRLNKIAVYLLYFQPEFYHFVQKI